MAKAVGCPGEAFPQGRQLSADPLGGVSMSLHVVSWPGVAGAMGLAIVFALTIRNSAPGVQRAAAAFGLAAVIPLFLVGAIWPSAFTIAALLALPGGVMLLAGIVRPSLLHGSKARAYTVVAVFLSPLCLLILMLGPSYQASASKYEIINSSSLLILDAGQVPPGECAAVGTVAIPQRKPGLFARHFGLAEEEFYRALDAQLEPLKANLLVPHEGSDAFAAGSSGQPFRGTAYSCP